MFRRISYSIAAFALILSIVWAGRPIRGAETMSEAEFAARLERMERENRALEQEIHASRGTVFPSESVLSEDSSAEVPEENRYFFQFADTPSEENALGYDYSSSVVNMSRDDLEGELARTKNWQWRKDSFTVTPYVWFWMSGTYETNQMAAGDFPLYVRPRFGEDERSHSYIDVKPSRLGLVVTAPECGLFRDSKISGVFEADFEGQYLTENKSDIAMRKAYFDVKNEDWYLLVGQTWELLGPLFPPTLNWGFGVTAGNFGFRRPMIRYDRYFRQRNGRLALQASVNSSNTIQSISTSQGVYDGEMGRWPDFQFRVERSYDHFGPWKEAKFSIGGHIGEREYEQLIDQRHVQSWSVQADWFFRFDEKSVFYGEVWTGELLAFSYCGIIQDLNPQTLESVGSTGGFAAFGHDFTKRLHFNVGCGVDDPWNSRLCRGMRSRNSIIFANLSYDFTKQFTVGYDHCYYRTSYFGQDTADSHYMSLVMTYKL